MSVASTASAGETASGLKTGIASWFLMVDANGQFYFFDAKAKKTAWGLPLRDMISEDEKLPHSRHGADDWVCCVDPGSGKKFYQSEKYGRLQWTPPMIYRARLADIPFFQMERVELKSEETTQFDEVKKPTLSRIDSLLALLEKISIEDVLKNSVTCSAFHRYLVAVHAEENLLFWGQCESFRTGAWFGMQILGINNPEKRKTLTLKDKKPEEFPEDEILDEGQEQLVQQLEKTRASVRMGLTDKRQSLGREARQIYDKFIRPKAEMEICIDSKAAERLLIRVTRGDIDKDMFVEAQEEVLRNMEEDLLPRFLKSALSEEEEIVGTGELTFKTDEVVRQAIRGLARTTSTAE